MNINEKNSENEKIYEISESSKLTNDKDKISMNLSKIITNTNFKINIVYIIIIFLIIIIFFLFLLSKGNFWLSSLIKNFNKKENQSDLYTNKWIVMTTSKAPKNYFEKLLNIISKDTWNILVIERGKKNKAKSWKKFIKENKIKSNNTFNKIIYLSLKDQKKLNYRTTELIPKDSYARKNIGYLYAIEHGAEEIFDIDDNIIFGNRLINTNITGFRLYYTNNISHMINPYIYYGRPDIWPRGFRYRDININDSNIFYTTMENRLLCKPLIFNGILKNLDLDSIFLQTKENIYDQNKMINIHFSYPLFYIPGNYAPINSKNTLFLYDVFPALALPISVSERVCDIWRGYLAQRYIWGYNRVIMYQNSDASFKEKISNVSLNLEKEKDLFFKIEKLLNCLDSDIEEKNIKNPRIFFIKLIEILVKNKILDKNDLNMFKAFLKDLESFGFKYKSDYKIKIDSNVNNYINTNPEFQFYIPSIPNINTFPKLNPNINLLKHYNINKKYDGILLIINYNYEFLTSLNNFLTNLYEPYFPNIVFISPGENETNYMSNSDNIILCPESHMGYYSYYCMKKVYEKYPSYKGYLFTMDDAFIKVWELDNLNFDIPWILTFCYLKTKIWFDSNDREELLLERNKNWQKNLRIFFNGNVIGHGISDFYYLPNYFIPDFIEVAKEFYNYTVFLEQAVPSIYGILMKPKYQYIYFIGLWKGEREKWKKYLYTSHSQIVVHPIKFSDKNCQNEIVKYIEFKKAYNY